MKIGNIYESEGQNGNVYSSGGLSPTINAGQGDKGRGIGSNNSPKVIVFDDYNSNIPEKQEEVGSVTTTWGHTALRNGWKILEIDNEERIDVQG